MDSRRVLLALAVVALLATSAMAATCADYNGKQAGARCHTPEVGKGCCTNGLWCDMGRCSARVVGDDEKLKQCKMFGDQPGSRCDINNGMCCAGTMKCNVGRCSA